MTHRPNVERAIAQVATWRGRRLKLRYRGTARNHAWLKRRTAALNLRNLIGKGLTRRDGAWVAGHLTRRAGSPAMPLTPLRPAAGRGPVNADYPGPGLSAEGLTTNAARNGDPATQSARNWLFQQAPR